MYNTPDFSALVGAISDVLSEDTGKVFYDQNSSGYGIPASVSSLAAKMGLTLAGVIGYQYKGKLVDYFLYTDAVTKNASDSSNIVYAGISNATTVGHGFDVPLRVNLGSKTVQFLKTGADEYNFDGRGIKFDHIRLLK
ncbi:MAG: hypothetical protein PF483_09995 [Halothiobacillus sp.]|jgi:hypothetical protein|nr:hypothetical protein [Halothiobacillus sp.]